MSTSNCNVEFKEFDGKDMTLSGNFKLDVPNNKTHGCYKKSQQHTSRRKPFGNNQRHVQFPYHPVRYTERWRTKKDFRGSWKSKAYHRKPWWKKYGRNYCHRNETTHIAVRFESNSGSPNSEKAKPAQKKSKTNAKICRSIYITNNGTTIKRFSDNSKTVTKI